MVRPELAGRQVECPKCKQRMLVTAENAAPQSPLPVSQPPALQPVVAPPAPQRQYQQPAPAPHSPAPLQPNPWNHKKKTDSNRTIVIGGVIAIGLVSLVVLAFAGMYFLQQSERQAQSWDQTTEPTPSPATSAPVTRPAEISSPVADTLPIPGGNSGTMRLVDLIEFVEPSVVRLDVKSKEGNSIGSGVFVDSNGTIVTNFHVVQGAYEIKVTTSDGQSAIATGFFQADPMKDLATIQVDPNQLSVVAIPLADTLPRKGAEVAAFGSPMGFSFSATEGVVSSIRSGKEVQEALKSLVGIDVYSLLGYSVTTNWIQMTAAISGGNSGGPLVNMQGKLIGINTWTNPAGQNLNFASTVDEIKIILGKTNNSSIQNFAALPKRRIQIEFDAPPGQKRPGQTRPGQRPPGRIASGNRNSRSQRAPGSTRRSPRTAPSNSAPPVVLTPEQIALRDAKERELKELTRKRLEERFKKMRGTENIVAAKEGKGFSTDRSSGVSRSFNTQSGTILDIALSPNDKYLATTSITGTVCVFNFKSGKLLYRIETEGRLIRAARFTSSPLELVTIRDEAIQSAKICFRAPETGVELREGLKGPGQQDVVLFAISPNGRSILGGWGQSIFGTTLWRKGALDGKLEKMKMHTVYGITNQRQPRAALFSGDSQTLMTGFDDGWISFSSGTRATYKVTVAREIHKGAITDMALSSDDRKILSGSIDGQLKLTTVNGKNWRSNRLGSAGSEIFGVALSDDDTLCAATRENNTIEIYDTSTRKLISTISTPTICSKLKFFGSDRFLVAGGKDGVVRIFNVPQ